MSEWENNRNECLSASRSLGRISTATRVIGILSILGGFLLLFAALDMRRSSDKMGFSIMALAVVLFGILVWSVGAFHSATARTIPALIERLDYLCMRAAPQLPAAAPAVVAPAVVAPAVVAPEQAPVADVQEPATEAAPEPEVEPEASPSSGTSQGRAPDQQTEADEQDPEPEPQAAPEPEEEIERTPCPHCGGLTHPAATRCVHCMKKIQRASA